MTPKPKKMTLKLAHSSPAIFMNQSSSWQKLPKNTCMIIKLVYFFVFVYRILVDSQDISSNAYIRFLNCYTFLRCPVTEGISKSKSDFLAGRLADCHLKRKFQVFVNSFSSFCIMDKKQSNKHSWCVSKFGRNILL